VHLASQSLIDRPANPANSVSVDLLTQPYEDRPHHFRHTGQRVAKIPERQLDSTLACERYAVMTASSHFEWTNALTAVARARECLVEAGSN
jgi:hypothetical protein